MKKVSLRDFQLKPTKYLRDLPIILTRYGKEIAFVAPPNAEIIYGTDQKMHRLKEKGEIGKDLSDEVHPVPKPKK